jgi:hypothetical protein
MLIGFSTGSLALGNVRLALQMIQGHGTEAIELSALREQELVPLVESLDSLDLGQFKYISLHAPSKLWRMTEREVVSVLAAVAERKWPIVVHPDVITEFDRWHSLGHMLCLENMDKRKSIGRTASELGTLFTKLPAATLCFDIGHARQIDPTMCEADTMLHRFGNRLQQIHLSLVNSRSVHEPLNYESSLAFRRVAHLLPDKIPIILETPVGCDGIQQEIEKAMQVQTTHSLPAQAVELLREAAGGDGMIIAMNANAGFVVMTITRQFSDPGNTRSEPLCRQVIRSLQSAGFIERTQQGGSTSEVYKVSLSGFKFIDSLCGSISRRR